MYQGQLPMRGNPNPVPDSSGFHTVVAVASGFQAMELWILCQWNLDSGFQSFAGSLIIQAGLQILKPRTPDSNSKIREKKIPRFWIPQAKISRFRNPEYLTWGNQLSVIGLWGLSKQKYKKYDKLSLVKLYLATSSLQVWHPK